MTSELALQPWLAERVIDDRGSGTREQRLVAYGSRHHAEQAFLSGYECADGPLAA